MPCGYVYVDGSSVGEITEVELKDRRILGEEGFISIFGWSTRPSARSSPARRSTRAGSPSRTRSSRTSCHELNDGAGGGGRKGNSDAHALQQVMRRVVGRWVDRLRRRPMIIPVVVEA